MTPSSTAISAICRSAGAAPAGAAPRTRPSETIPSDTAVRCFTAPPPGQSTRNDRTRAALADRGAGEADPGGLVGRLERQVDREGGALAELALDGDLAAVELDEAAGERQPEARPLGAGAAGLGELLELPEQPRQILARDADAGVGDADDDVAGGGAGDEADDASPGGELDGVRDQVVEDLLDAPGIDVDLG